MIPASSALFANIIHLIPLQKDMFKLYLDDNTFLFPC